MNVDDAERSDKLNGFNRSTVFYRISVCIGALVLLCNFLGFAWFALAIINTVRHESLGDAMGAGVLLIFGNLLVVIFLGFVVSLLASMIAFWRTGPGNFRMALHGPALVLSAVFNFITFAFVCFIAESVFGNDHFEKAWLVTALLLGALSGPFLAWSVFRMSNGSKRAEPIPQH